MQTPPTSNEARGRLDLSRIAQDLQIRRVQVESVVEMLDEGNTIPFIARYRKERTGELDEDRLRAIESRVGSLRALEERKKTVLDSVDGQKKLTEELRAAIVGAESTKRLEDLFLPYKPKKKTEASQAREQGLEGLALAIWHRDPAVDNLEELLPTLVDPDKGLTTTDEVLNGVRHILAELVSESADVRAGVRSVMWETGKLRSTKNPKLGEKQGVEYKTYFDFSEGIRHLPAHRILAINRGEKEHALEVKLEWDTQGGFRLALDRIPIPIDDEYKDPSAALFQPIDAGEPAPIQAAAPPEPEGTEATEGTEPQQEGTESTEGTESQQEGTIATETTEPTETSPATTEATEDTQQESGTPEATPATTDEKQEEPEGTEGAEGKQEEAEGEEKPKSKPPQKRMSHARRMREVSAKRRDALKAHPHSAFLESVVKDALERLLEPDLVREIRKELTGHSEHHAIGVFARNLRGKLLARPVEGKRVLGIDPGFRTGCRVAALDEKGALLDQAVIYPHPPQKRTREARHKLEELIRKHGLQVIAIGNGTASRETEELVASLMIDLDAIRRGEVPPSRKEEEARRAAQQKAAKPEQKQSEEKQSEEKQPEEKQPEQKTEGSETNPSEAVTEETQPTASEPSTSEQQPTTNEPTSEEQPTTSEPTPEEQPTAGEPTPKAEGNPSEASDNPSEAVSSTTSEPTMPPGWKPPGGGQPTEEEKKEGEAGPELSAVGSEGTTGSEGTEEKPVGTEAPTVGEPQPQEATPEPTSSEEGKPDEPKTEDPKTEEPKAEDAKTDEPMAEEPTAEPTTSAEAKPDETKPEEAKTDEAKGEGAKKGSGKKSKSKKRKANRRPLPDLSSLPMPVEELVYVIVNEAGANVYSSSPIGREEFPDLDAGARGTISIGRRLQDPLAELVKIEAHHVGVGLYQHDMAPQKMQESLEKVVESCVNTVGVDLNSASVPLLRYVSGMNQLVARDVVEYRKSHGPFRTRESLKQVPGMGETRYHQAVGFLRVSDGDTPLDNTWVHPENYEVARTILGELELGENDLKDETKLAQLREKAKGLEVEKVAERLGVGAPTLKDILDALCQPGRDPRDDLPAPMFKKGVLQLEDLEPGRELEGTVLNVVDFGAFVDVGLKDSGLVHISQLANRFVKNPYDVVTVGDVVTVWVKSVDMERRHVSLTMVKPGTERKPPRKRGGSGPEGGRRESPEGGQRQEGEGRGRPPRRGEGQRQGQGQGEGRGRQQRGEGRGGPRGGRGKAETGPGGLPPRGTRRNPKEQSKRPRRKSESAETGGGSGSGREQSQPPRRSRREAPKPHLSDSALAGETPLGTFAELAAFWNAQDSDQPGEKGSSAAQNEGDKGEKKDEGEAKE